MNTNARSTTLVALVVALGGFLMGFDSAVISGVVGPLTADFQLSPGQVGTAVACLTLSATLAMAMAGPLADRYGRKPILMIAAVAFSVSAIWSALATGFASIVAARLLGGLGVGAALLIAPLYIAEIAPAEKRGRLVSFNQLNIVLGFSAAFFSNYFLEQSLGQDGASPWRWMLGVEAIPAVLYLLLLFIVPKSPRWLATRGRTDEARAVLAWANGEEQADEALAKVRESIEESKQMGKVRFAELLHPRLRFVMVVGLGLGFFQQITGINAIFYYATTIFELAGADRNASLAQAIWVGIVNVVFTVIAMRLIDQAGRKPLLIVGTTMMAAALLTNAWAFHKATYDTSNERYVAAVEGLGGEFPVDARAALASVAGGTFEDQSAFRAAIDAAVADLPEKSRDAAKGQAENLAKSALDIRGVLVLIAIMTYIAGFAISLGPVMWAMFSEIFPMRLRGVAISAAGFFNSLVSYLVQQLFPVGLSSLGPATIFLIFGIFAVLALLFSMFVVPETKGRSLEELEAELIRG